MFRDEGKGMETKTLPLLPVTHNHYSLKSLSKALLGVDIQTGAHDIVKHSTK